VWGLGLGAWGLGFGVSIDRLIPTLKGTDDDQYQHGKNWTVFTTAL